MTTYFVKVRLDRLFCKDTESIHSSDKFALSGVVHHGGTSHAFLLPLLRINDWETYSYPPDLALVFEGEVPEGEITVDLLAWDLDENDGWIENRDDIQKAARAIEIGLSSAGQPEVAAAMATVVEYVTKVIDQFVEWDKNDLLLSDRRVIRCAGGLNTTTYQQVEVPFWRHEEPIDYSGYDYTLKYEVESASFTPFGDEPPPALSYEPARHIAPEQWIGSWAGDGVCADVGLTAAGGLRAATTLDVTVVEKAGWRNVTTTSHVPVERDGVRPGVLVDLLDDARVHGPVADAARGVLAKDVPDQHDRLAADPPVDPGLLDPAHRPIRLQDRNHGAAGDHVLLADGATLECLRRTDLPESSAPHALRYLRPGDPLLRAGDPSARDVTLTRRSSL